MIRSATAADIPAVCNIYEEIHTREEAGISTVGWVRGVYPTRDTVVSALAADELFVLEQDGQVVAAARINQTQGEEYAQVRWSVDAPPEQVMVMHTLAVSPAAMGTGLGRQFLSFYEDYARQQGCPFLRIDTNERNAYARALYRRLGYREAGIIPCVFNGIGGVHLVCLEKTLCACIPSG